MNCGTEILFRTLVPGLVTYFFNIKTLLELYKDFASLTVKPSLFDA